MASTSSERGEGAGPAAAESTLSIVGGEVRAHSPVGGEVAMPLEDFLLALRGDTPDSRGHIYPAGVKAHFPVHQGVIVVHQTEPRVHPLRWLADDSTAPHGREAKYRVVRIALPYVLVLAVFQQGPGGLHLTHHNEVFFLDRPLASTQQKLFFPALLNCGPITDARWGPQASWVCTGNLRRTRTPRAADPLAHELDRLIRHVFESGFNSAVDHMERPSWYTATIKQKVDPRIATMEAWEAASQKDPLFALDVPWLPTKKTLAQVIERMRRIQGNRPLRVRDLELLVLNQPRKKWGTR